ncbi:MAG: PaaI family thioesterase, partial [Phycisphaeraceae bacterium]|nr:PaaI family thioesterase [Phycisphaeraceae bacterium]
VMDDAAFFAVNSLVEDVFVLTVSFNIYLLRPVVGGTMSATGKVVNASRNLWIAESTLVDGDCRTLGRGSGSFMRSKSALVDVKGYVEAP